jgi:uncharacterized protein
MSQNDVLQDGDTLIVPDGATAILYGQTTRKLARVSASQLPSTRDVYAQQGFFRQFNHTPTHQLCRVWHGFSSLMLLVTRRCNLRCSYCYANAQSDGPLMSEELALGAADQYLRNLPETAKISVSFHGGGEPTLNLPVMRTTVKHALEQAHGRPCHFSLVTNGTFDMPTAEWLIEHQFGISISWDGPPHIQDRNRPFVGGQPTSGHLERLARFLHDRGYPFSVRTTLSPKDDVRATIDYFAMQGVRNLHLEPLFPNGRDYQDIAFGNSGKYEVYAPTGRELAQLFLTAIDACEHHGIVLRSTAVNGGLPPWHGPMFCGHACGRGMVATHDGFLTACSEVVDACDPAAPAYHYGAWDAVQHAYRIDETKLARVLKRHINNIPECRDCFAKYACGGGCAIKAFRRTSNLLGIEPENCTFVRTLIPELIRRRAAQLVAA